MVIDPNSSNVTDLLESSQSRSEPVVDIDKFEKGNKKVRGHLLNHMTNSLFDLFVVQKLEKTIWDTLESSMEEMMQAVRSMTLESGCNFR